MTTTAIICDIDGVICDLFGTLLSAFNERWPESALERPDEWFTTDAYPDLTDAQYQWWDAAFDNPYYYATSLPVAYAKEMIHGARLFHHDVYFRSSRSAHLYTTTRAWLEAWGFLKHDAPESALVCGNRAKGDAAFLPYDRIVYIDDNLPTLIGLRQENLATTVSFSYFLIDQRYNQYDTRPGIRRISSVRDLPLLFGELWEASQPARAAVGAGVP